MMTDGIRYLWFSCGNADILISTGGEYAKTAGAKCPLNVCCSEFGFCGMTEEFCTKGSGDAKGCQSNCDQPGSGASGGDVQSRIIGYYESWAHDRSCTGMVSVQLPKPHSPWLTPVLGFQRHPCGRLDAFILLLWIHHAGRFQRCTNGQRTIITLLRSDRSEEEEQRTQNRGCPWRLDFQ